MGNAIKYLGSEKALLAVFWCLVAVFLWTHFSAVKNQELQPDVQGYVSIATSRPSFYESGVREPLLVALVRGGLSFSSEEKYGVKLLGLFFHFLTALLFFSYARKVSSFFTAFFSTVLILSNTLLLFDASAGLRDTFFLFGV